MGAKFDYSSSLMQVHSEKQDTFLKMQPHPTLKKIFCPLESFEHKNSINVTRSDKNKYAQIKLGDLQAFQTVFNKMINIQQSCSPYNLMEQSLMQHFHLKPFTSKYLVLSTLTLNRPVTLVTG